MRPTILISVGIYIIAATSHLVKRQASDDVLLASIVELIGKVMKPVSISTAKPQVRTSAKRQQSRYGPISVLPRNQSDSESPSIFSPLITQPDPHSFGVIAKLDEGLCINCTVVAASANLLFQNGTLVPLTSSVKQQHITLFDVTAKSQNFLALCPGDLSDPNLMTTSPTRSPFLDDLSYAGTSWFVNPQSTVERGHFIGEDVFMLQADILNEAAVKEDIYIQLDLEFLPGRIGRESFKNYISVSGCDLALSFADNIRSTRTSNATGVIADGTLFYGRAHMGGGGESMSLYLNDKKICTSMAVYENDKWVKGSDCFIEVPVKKGDYLKVDATYDLPKHPSYLSKKNTKEQVAVFEIGYSEA